jgi:general stress protein 26
MKTTTAEEDPRAAAKLRALIDDIAVAMVVTVTPDGALRSRPMLTQDVEEEGELWFFTSAESGMVHDIAEEHAVNINYSDPAQDRYVSVSGQATLIRERSKVEELWSSTLSRYFPRGMDDPDLALLRVRIESAEYWDSSRSQMVPVREESDANAPSKHAKAPGSGAGEKFEHTKVDIRAAQSTG